MEIVNISTVMPDASGTRTVAQFSQLLGAARHPLGIVARQKPNLTSVFLTEALGNVMVNGDLTKATKAKKINARAFEWQIEHSHIKRPKVVSAAVELSPGIYEVWMNIDYYNKADVFQDMRTKEQFYVKQRIALQNGSAKFKLIVQNVSSNIAKSKQAASLIMDSETRWLFSPHPELSEEGFAKFDSNASSYRNHMSYLRVDVSVSSEYLATNSNYEVTVKGTNKDGKEEMRLYSMPSVDKQGIDNFMAMKNNYNLHARSTMDKYGKSTLTDELGREVIIGDGIISMIEKYAERVFYSREFKETHFLRAIDILNGKAAEIAGNKYIYVVNSLLWSSMQKQMRTTLQSLTPVQSIFYSQETRSWRNVSGKQTINGVKVGATFTTYEFGGNQITFVPDKALDVEYPDKGYGILVSLNEETTGVPAIQAFTLGNDKTSGEFMRNTLTGTGGIDGTSSGPVSSPVAGSKYMYTGYSGIAVFSPNKSVIIMQTV